MTNAFRPVCSAAINVEPLPPNRSRTCSLGRDEYCMARTPSSTGFSVKCQPGKFVVDLEVEDRELGSCAVDSVPYFDAREVADGVVGRVILVFLVVGIAETGNRKRPALANW